MIRSLILAALFLGLAPLPAQADQASALAAVRSKPGVLDALIDDKGNLWVVVKNSQLDWTQYAVFMCEVVRPHQARVFLSKVVDVTSVGKGKKPAEWKQLAQVSCTR